MRAVIVEHAGGPEGPTLREMPRPTPGYGEVLIRVGAAAVNPVDAIWRNPEAVRRLIGGDPFPWIPGWDVAGTVEAVGHGVARFAPGDRVFGTINFPRPAGAYAEYTVGHVSHLGRTPEGISDIEAAALALAGLTAWQGLIDAGRLRSGERVLIVAAAGGVGHLAVQIARHIGAHVIAVGSTANLDYLRSLGVHEVVDRTAGPINAAVEPVDLAFNAAYGETAQQAFVTVRPGGRFVSITREMPKAPRADVTSTGILIAPDSYEVEQLAALVVSGGLRPTIAEVLPLEQAARAHELIATGTTRGKIVLTTGG
jgi:NADPH:quinone reductase-like Zn-dependent oxidoreductase